MRNIKACGPPCVNKAFRDILFFRPSEKISLQFSLINVIDNSYIDIWHFNHADMSFAV